MAGSMPHLPCREQRYLTFCGNRGALLVGRARRESVAVAANTAPVLARPRVAGASSSISWGGGGGLPARIAAKAAWR
jgi:hypothetical protein